MKTLYHASYCVVDKPDLNHTRTSLDFGPGFYLTSNLTQANKWAARQFTDHNSAYINTYSFNDKKLNNFNVKIFDSFNTSWLRFIMNCRFQKDKSKYDIVIGPVADDRVYESTRLFLMGIITEQETIKRLKNKKCLQQVCIRSEDALANLLTFKGADKYESK